MIKPDAVSTASVAVDRDLGAGPQRITEQRALVRHIVG
jgi:hypothetical protein